MLQNDEAKLSKPLEQYQQVLPEGKYYLIFNLLNKKVEEPCSWVIKVMQDRQKISSEICVNPTQTT